ncbi:MAG: hypothetical protein WDK96_01495 [Candidatus Paceibacterota bacterium]|jgi:hypothetical protein
MKATKEKGGSMTKSKNIVPLEEARETFFRSIRNAMKIFEISLLKNRLASSKKGRNVVDALMADCYKEK